MARNVVRMTVTRMEHATVTPVHASACLTSPETSVRYQCVLVIVTTTVFVKTEFVTVTQDTLRLIVQI